MGRVIRKIATNGHGRLKTSHRPEQRSGETLKYTTYNYNPDDSILNITDGRGVVTNYIYNSRGLVEEMTWDVGETGVTDAHDVEFSYDALGNRTSMTDGLGTVAYEYDPLSRMTAETRVFSDTLPNKPTGNYRIGYEYTIGGRLGSLTDPFGYRVDYAYDKLSRLQAVDSPTAFNGISTYAEDPVYDARGTLRGLSYGNGTEMSVTGFNGKLQATGFEVKKDATAIIGKEYEFYADGALKFVDDAMDEAFDRSYKYDHMGRTVEAKAGTAARGESPTGPHNFDQPYSRTYQHDAFGKITAFNGFFYGSESNLTVSFTNGRNSNWTYDSDGNVTADLDGSYDFDAAGRLVEIVPTDIDDENIGTLPVENHFDGNGDLAKLVRNAGSTEPEEITNYYIRSTILNRVISETTGAGAKQKTFIPANGVTLAEQSIFYGESAVETIRFIHQDASGSGVQQTLANGTAAGGVMRTGEYDAMGRNVADPGPYIALNTEMPGDGGSGIDLFGTGEGYRPGRNTYTINGLPATESQFMMEIESGHIGGTFGLIEMAARMSAPRYLVTDTYITEAVYWGTDWEQAGSAARRSETMTVHRVFFEGWSILNSIVPYTQPPGDAGGGEGNGNESLPTPSFLDYDPCAGKKGALDHHAAGDTGIAHISPRHIDQESQYKPGGSDPKSFYIFGPLVTDSTASWTSNQRNQMVINWNQEAFEKGGAIIQGNRIAYVYAPYYSADYLGGLVRAEGHIVGYDVSRNYEYTNVRTVVVAADCKTVITSFPGLPKSIDSTDPRINGSPTWWRKNTSVHY